MLLLEQAHLHQLQLAVLIALAIFITASKKKKSFSRVPTFNFSRRGFALIQLSLLKCILSKGNKSSTKLQNISPDLHAGARLHVYYDGHHVCISTIDKTVLWLVYCVAILNIDKQSKRIRSIAAMPMQ